MATIERLRALAQETSELVSRARLSLAAGLTFNGARDLYAALGYARVLLPTDYRARYRRGGIAARIVEAKPEDTWRGGFELVEQPNDEKLTPFEQAWVDLDQRVDLVDAFHRVDVLAGLGHYAILVIGAPGKMDEPLEQCSPADVVYVQPYAEEDAKIMNYEIDDTSPRYGHPTMYQVKRSSPVGVPIIGGAQLNGGKQVHWTRVIHVADGLLDDPVFGQPRLERVWNLCDDLEKVTGGGSEAYWNRANQGMQIDIDPSLKLDAEQKSNLKDQLDNYKHKLERNLRTRGAKITTLGSDVADFKDPAETLQGLISASVGIPQRVLMGSEQGKLAAEQDSVKYYRMIEARRVGYAESRLVRPFATRLIGFGALPKPAAPWSCSWSQLRTLDDAERADLAKKYSDLNATDLVVLPDEVRKVLGLAPLTPAERAAVTPSADQKMLERALRSGDVRTAEKLLDRVLGA